MKFIRCRYPFPVSLTMVLAALLACLFVASPVAVGADTAELAGYDPPASLGKLKEAWRFSPVDRPEHRLPSFDDSSWPTITGFPHNWKTATPPARSEANTVWYRLHFKTPADAPERPLLIYVSSTVEAHELYLNGVLVGGTGVIAPGAESPRETALDKPGFHPVPQGLLVQGGENVLALRVQSGYPNQGGLMFSYSDITLGYEKDMLVNFFLHHMSTLAIIIVFFTAAALFLSLYLVRPGIFENLFFGLSSLTFGIYFFLRTPVKYFIIDDALVLKRAEFMMLYVMIFLFMDFVYFFINRTSPPHRRERLTAIMLNIIPVVSVAANLTTDNPMIMEQQFINGVVYAWAAPFLFMFWLIGSRALRGDLDARLMLAGITFGFLATINDILVQNRVLPWSRVGHYSYLFMLVIFASIVAGRYLRLHRELRQLKNYLINIIQSMPSALIAVDERGRVTQWNRRAEELAGIRETDAIGQNLFTLHPALGEYKTSCVEVIQRLQPRAFHRKILPGQEQRFHDITLYPLVNNGDTGVVIRLDDVTESERREQLLRHAQKMEVLGTLAGGLAHDFNNILSAIGGAVSLMKLQAGKKEGVEPGDIRECTDLVEGSIARAAALVKQLLAVGKKGEVVFAEADLNEIISGVVKLSAAMFKKEVGILAIPYHLKAAVYADAGQLEQMLLNLCVNAYHAMTVMRKEGEPRGGTITMMVGRATGTEIAGVDDTYWKITVADTGVGIPAESMEKIFDPFYTTKEGATGSGLGLAMVYSIVQLHQGYILINSETGQGTEISVLLPRLGESV